MPAECELLLVEGTGVLRTSLTSFFDATVFVQADSELAYQRLLSRDGDTAENRDCIAQWGVEENSVLARERPWDRADLVVCGTPEAIGLRSAAGELLVGIRVAVCTTTACHRRVSSSRSSSQAVALQVDTRESQASAISSASSL